MAYSRLFITLGQGDDCYAAGSRPALGKCVIEYRNGSGRILLQAQGVKSGSYRVCLVGDKGYWEVPVPLYIRYSGRGELRRSLDMDGINAKSEDIRAAAVLDGSKTVLVGFAGEEFNWQSCMMHPVAELQRNEEKSAEKSVEKSSENTAEKTAVKTGEKAAANTAEKTAVKADEKSVDKWDKEYKADSCEKAEKSEKSEKPCNLAAEVIDLGSNKDLSEQDGREKIKSIILSFDKKVDEIKELGSRTNEDCIFSCSYALTPFGDDGILWVRAGLRELSAIKSLWKYYNNPFVVHNCRRYKHLLLGKGDGFYMLAVPCQYKADYKTEARLQGFSGYKPVKGGSLKENEYCYCILKC